MFIYYNVVVKVMNETIIEKRCSKCNRVITIYGDLSRKICIPCDEGRTNQFRDISEWLKGTIEQLENLKIYTMKDNELFKATELLEIVRKDIDPREKGN